MDRDKTAIRVYSNNQPTEPERVPIPQKVTLAYATMYIFLLKLKPLCSIILTAILGLLF